VYGAGVIDVPVDSHHISFETDRTKRFGAFAPEHFNDDNATRGGGTITVRMRNRRNRCRSLRNPVYCRRKASEHEFMVTWPVHKSHRPSLVAHALSRPLRLVLWQGLVNEDEHFMVWMRPAALPSFRKLFGRLHTKLHKGDTLNLDVLNR
jgi:hypothetical protein